MIAGEGGNDRVGITSRGDMSESQATVGSVPYLDRYVL